jgi:hypothetical protein
MMLMPNLAKEREFDPCKCWVVPVPDSHKEKIRRFGEVSTREEFYIADLIFSTVFAGEGWKFPSFPSHCLSGPPVAFQTGSVAP